MTSKTLALRYGPVSQAAPEPLYGQIVANVKREIAARRLLPGDVLPSARALAADLSVSVITAVRAYEDLERNGVVYSRQGLGTFVAETAIAKLKAERRMTIKSLLAALTDAAREEQVSDAELLALLESKLKEKKT